MVRTRWRARLGWYNGRRTVGEASSLHYLGRRRRPRSCAHSALCRSRRGRLRRARDRASADGLPAVAEPAGGPQRGARSLAGSLSASLPHDSHLQRPVGAPDVDLSDRRQSGAQPPALVAPPPPLAAGVARRAHPRPWRAARARQWRLAGTRARSEAPRRASAVRARRPAVRSAHGARPARDRRPELRRDRLFARHRRWNGEIAARTRARGPSRAIEGRMTLLTCSAVRRRLQAFYDRELPVRDLIDIEAHLSDCPPCTRDLRELRLLGEGVRLASPPGPADDWNGLQTGVISRMRAEAHESWTARTKRALDDMHLVWIGLAATAATCVCAFSVLSMLTFAAPERNDSLAAMIAVMAAPSGSDLNPARLDTYRMRAPSVPENGIVYA